MSLSRSSLQLLKFSGPEGFGANPFCVQSSILVSLRHIKEKNISDYLDMLASW